MLKSLAPIIFNGDEADLESSTARAEQAVRAAFVWPIAGVSAEKKNSCVYLMSYQPAPCPKLEFQWSWLVLWALLGSQAPKSQSVI